MKKYIVTAILILITGIQLKAQKRIEQVFTSVPVTNGKVVFRQFIYTGSDLSAEQKYALLCQWSKDNYSGNPHLISMRFNNENLSITVSSKVEFNLSGNNGGKNKKMLMSYRFDASITNAGCIFVVRDINYEQIDAEGNSALKKIFTAEEMITDTAIASSSGEQKELKLNLQKQTLTFVNDLYNNLSSIFN
mgnify:FL=1